MNFIDLTKNGGYRFKQFTLRKMQEAYFQILKMFVAFCNVPEVGNFIISGCKIVGPNITSGYVYIDGELCFFEQTTGTLLSKIKKNVVIQSLGFRNGQNEEVFRYTSAIIDLVDGEVLSNFTRIYPVFDNNYVHTDNNYTTLEVNKLNGIEPLAQVNIKPNWTAASGSASEILNKPVIPNVLYIGQKDLYNFPSGSIEGRVVNFPDVGTNNYMVLYSIKSEGVEVLPIQALYNIDLIHQVSTFTSTSFNIIGFEFNSSLQNLTLHYMLVELPPL